MTINRLYLPATVFVLSLFILVTAGCSESKEELAQKDSNRADGVYTGTALRGEADCFSDGDCFYCTTTDEITLERRDGKITFVARGAGLTFTPCKQSSSAALEAWTLKGESGDYLTDGWRTFNITDCNSGAFPGAGSGTIEGNKVTVSLSCRLDDSGSKAEWNDVVLTKKE